MKDRIEKLRRKIKVLEKENEEYDKKLSELFRFFGVFRLLKKSTREEALQLQHIMRLNKIGIEMYNEKLNELKNKISSKKKVCFYCKKQVTVEEFQSPISHEIHLVCKDCQNAVLYMYRQRKKILKLGYLRYYGIPFFLLCSIISFIFFSWRVGVLFIIVAGMSGIISYLGMEYSIKKKSEEIEKIRKELLEEENEGLNESLDEMEDVQEDN